MIRVLIAEDSITQREILRRLLEDDPQLSVIAEARNGQEAVALALELKPDVVIMDIHMPLMDGIAATREIMAKSPMPIVVASATLKKRDIDHALYAYQAGAVAVIEKPEGAVLLNLSKIGPRLRDEVIAAARAKMNLQAWQPTTGDGGLADNLRSRSISVIGICASTGGPPVLLEILSNIPRPFRVPALLVQHISTGFEEGFARWLSDSTGQTVGLARNGQRVEAGIWLAPSGRHLTLGSQTRLELIEARPGDIHCPSGDPLFVSLGRQLGPRSAGILLTGMGDDGAAGLAALKAAGGMTIIQNEASCLIWGMPRAAQALGAACCEMNPKQIAQALTAVASGE